MLMHILMSQTHFVASFVAGFVATAVCSPVDNVKTRLMNANPGQFKGEAFAEVFS